MNQHEVEKYVGNWIVLRWQDICAHQTDTWLEAHKVQDTVEVVDCVTVGYLAGLSKSGGVIVAGTVIVEIENGEPVINMASSIDTFPIGCIIAITPIYDPDVVTMLMDNPMVMKPVKDQSVSMSKKGRRT